MKKLLLVISAVLMAGCTTQTAYINGTDGRLMYEKSHAFFLNGIVQEKVVNAVEICGGEQNISKIESHLSGTDALWGLITFGIYAPRTARVYCQETYS